MAMAVRFALHREKKQAAVFYGGDEHGFLPLPAGWEELMPRQRLTEAAAFERWCRLELDERLAALAPPGFECLKGLRQP